MPNYHIGLNIVTDQPLTKEQMESAAQMARDMMYTILPETNEAYQITKEVEQHRLYKEVTIHEHPDPREVGRCGRCVDASADGDYIKTGVIVTDRS